MFWISLCILKQTFVSDISKSMIPAKKVVKINMQTEDSYEKDQLLGENSKCIKMSYIVSNVHMNSHKLEHAKVLESIYSRT